MFLPLMATASSSTRNRKSSRGCSFFFCRQGDALILPEYAKIPVSCRLKGHKTDLELRMRATAPNGLLLWAGEKHMGASSDFLALGLDAGHVVLMYNLGSGDVTIAYNATRVDDGRWHRIRLRRFELFDSICLRHVTSGVLTGTSESDHSRSTLERSLRRSHQANSSSSTSKTNSTSVSKTLALTYVLHVATFW